MIIAKIMKLKLHQNKRGLNCLEIFSQIGFPIIFSIIFAPQIVKKREKSKL